MTGRPKLKLPKLKPAPIFIALLVVATVLALVSVWTGDQRWLQTAGVLCVPAFFAGMAWVGTL